MCRYNKIVLRATKTKEVTIGTAIVQNVTFKFWKNCFCKLKKIIFASVDVVLSNRSTYN